MRLSPLNSAKIAHFEDHFGEPHGMFACQASVPLIFSTDLLYKMWLNFNTYSVNAQTKKIPHWAVSDLILSSLCQPVGYQLYKLDTEIRIYLQQLLVERLGATRQIQLAEFLQQFAERHYTGIEKNIQEIHLLTAASILDPVAMEKQLSSQLQEKIVHGGTDVINLLTLYFNLSGEKKQDAEGENYINLVAEDDSSTPGFLHVILPDFLQGMVKEKQAEAIDGRQDHIQETSPSLKAISIVEACLQTGNTLLDLGNCGLTDADFAEGGPLDKAVRQCTHIRRVVLSNEWYRWDKSSLKRIIQQRSNDGKKNKISRIPACISQLTSLLEFMCNGEPADPWSITDISPLEGLRMLNSLNLSNNKIATLSGLQNLYELVELDLSNNRITDLTDLQSLNGLESLDIRYNLVSSLSPLLNLFPATGLDAKEQPPIYLRSRAYFFGNPIIDLPEQIQNKENKAAIYLLYDFNNDHHNEVRIRLKVELEKYKTTVVSPHLGYNLREDEIVAKECDGVILFYGNASSEWFLIRQSMLLDLDKAKATAIFLTGPDIEIKMARDAMRNMFIIITEEKMQTGLQRFLKSPSIKEKSAIKEEYLYDIYISYSHNSAITEETVEVFLDELHTFSFEINGKKLNVFIDKSSIEDGMDLPENMKQALIRSRIMLTLLTPSYFKRRNSLLEITTFKQRSESTGISLIFPIILFKGVYLENPLISSIQSVDLSIFNLYAKNFKESPEYPYFSDLLRSLIRQINSRVSAAPPFDPQWIITDDKQIDDILEQQQDLIPDLTETAPKPEKHFYERDELADIILKSKKNFSYEEIKDYLLIFSTRDQHTWLVFTNINVYCILDDLPKRGTRKLIQWSQELVNVLNKISVTTHKKNTGLLHIGKKRNWLYSYKLFEEPDNNIISTINRYIIRCMDHDDSAAF